MAAHQHANARPGSSRTAGPTLKLHRRVVRLDGRAHTVLTLRPVAEARYSTNYFHETWHVLSDAHGAQVLARLLWGLSYQARPGTLILLDEVRLDPNPFDAEPPMLVALVPAGLTGCSATMLRELKHTPQRHAAPAGTVRWRTHGLDLATGPTAASAGGNASSGAGRPPCGASPGLGSRSSRASSSSALTGTGCAGSLSTPPR